MKKGLLLFVIGGLVYISQLTYAAHASGAPLFTGLIISWEQKNAGNATLWIQMKEYPSGAWTKWYEVRPDEDSYEKENETTCSSEFAPGCVIFTENSFKEAERAALARAQRGQSAYAACGERPLEAPRTAGLEGGCAPLFEGNTHSQPSQIREMLHETLFSTNLSSEVRYEIRGDNKASITNITIEKIRSDRPGEKSLFASLFIPRELRIISRREWGADETQTVKNAQPDEERGNDGGQDEAAERSPVSDNDPAIKRIVTHDSEGREFLWPLQYAKKIRFIVIHHTASVSNLDNPKTAIQNIAYYHTVKKKWGDIGYNYIIDTQGNMYEGRRGGEGVVGGHARPVNKTSIGIAVMGNYAASETPAPVVRTLTAFIAAKSKKYGIKLEGKTRYKGTQYNNVQGHNENTATTCPGKFLTQKIGGIQKFIAYAKDAHRTKETEKKQRFAAADIERRTIVAIPPDTKSQLTIRLKNTGTAAWNSKTYLENTGETGFFPKVLARLTEGKKIKSGEIGDFNLTLPSTLVSGLYVTPARLVVNGSAPVQTTFPLAIHVEGVSLKYEVVKRSDPPGVTKAGEKARASITLKNLSNVTWRSTGKNPMHIGLIRPQDRTSPFFGERKRVGKMMEKLVKPGGLATFTFDLKAPKKGGTYTEYFGPVMEGVSWAADSGLNWTIQVETKEKPLRVALSFKKKKTVIKSAAGMRILTPRGIRRFKKNQEVTVSVTESGTYRIKSGATSFELAAPPRFTALGDGILELKNYVNRPAWNKSLNDNLYRGILEVRRIDDKLVVINELPIEDYLKGIAEISNDAPKEKIKTIIILSRSYALYYRDIVRKFPLKPYDLDDDPDHTQKYIGYSFELRAPFVAEAVKETEGVFVTYEGKQVLTPYFNQSDGRTRSAEEVWGWKDRPYLQSVEDRFCGTTELKGHGVGLSGCGATKLAESGKSAEEIIKYYYKGVELSDKK